MDHQTLNFLADAVFVIGGIPWVVIGWIVLIGLYQAGKAILKNESLV